jgi:rhodanese-related sulfurtransferase
MYKEETPYRIYQRLKQRDPIEVIDVREPSEWRKGHIEQAKHIPLGEIPERLAELDRNKETVLVCQSGMRSSKACEFLQHHGFNVTNMSGGMSSWFWEVR